jgi:TctA family transporter
MLLGVKADLATDRRQQEFLPEHLLYDFDRAQIYINGEYRPMVKERRTLVPAGVQIIEQDFLFSPTECACALLILSIVILAFEWRRKKSFRIWDGLLMVAQGLVGLVLFVMLFSQHPTTSTNLQILLLNPLPFFFLPAVARRRSTRWWILLTVMFVLFMIGSLFQQYAEGMQIVALCLLLRSAIHFKMKA